VILAAAAAAAAAADGKAMNSVLGGLTVNGKLIVAMLLTSLLRCLQLCFSQNTCNS